MMQKTKASGLHEDSADFAKFNIEELLLQEVGVILNLNNLNRASSSVTPKKQSAAGCP